MAPKFFRQVRNIKKGFRMCSKEAFWLRPGLGELGCLGEGVGGEAEGSPCPLPLQSSSGPALEGEGLTSELSAASDHFLVLDLLVTF